MRKDRTDYVHAAAKNIPCRFQLCRVAAKATRALHGVDARLEATMNKTLTIIGEGRPVPRPPKVYIKDDGSIAELLDI
jgi:hypothetical protein